MPDISEGFVFADEKEAQAACEWWQKELNVPHWHVAVDFVRWRELKDNEPGEQAARIHYSEAHETARISLLSAIDKWECEPGDTPFDHECNLVHELLHLVYAAALNGNETLQERQATNRTARALVRLRRLAYPEPPWRCS